MKTRNIKFKNLKRTYKQSLRSDDLKFRNWRSVAILLFIFAIIFSFGRLAKLLELKQIHNDQLALQAQAVSNVAEDIEIENKEMKARLDKIDAKSPKPTQKEIESYIKTIFGKDGRVAVAVSHHECGPTNKAYPGCVLQSDVEYSVGVFQINLKNKTHMIHAAKVPGNSIEEKAENLKDPYINTLIAYKIFKDSNGFTPWSAYLNKSYLSSLE
jgi:hypothetical protein